MITAPFSGPRLKVYRAKHHVGDLDAQISQFLKTHSNALVIDRDLGSNWYSASHVAPPPLPFEWSAIIGDAIHNLRAALDLLMCDLVLIHGGDNAKIDKVYFPFCDSGDYLETRIKERNVHLAGPNVVDEILLLKPYKGGNHDLWCLHQLDIDDKHTGVIPVNRVFGKLDIGDVKAVFVSEGSRRVNGIGGFDIRYRVLTTAGNFKVGDNFEVSIYVLFGKGEFESKPVLVTLKQICEVVSGIVERFAALCSH